MPETTTTIAFSDDEWRFVEFASRACGREPDDQFVSELVSEGLSLWLEEAGLIMKNAEHLVLAGGERLKASAKVLDFSGRRR